MAKNSIELSEEQLSVFRAIEESSDNIFVTGKAGTGKSVLLRYLVENSSREIAIVAPTGIAAVNVGGQTIHSFFGLDSAVQDVRDGLFSARVDDQYRVVFSILEEEKLLSLLYAGPRGEAYQFANKYKVEVNPAIGGLQQVEKAPRRVTSQAGTAKKLSRLAPIDDAQFVAMEVPEEYWEQLREKVFTAGQLTGLLLKAGKGITAKRSPIKRVSLRFILGRFAI